MWLFIGFSQNSEWWQVSSGSQDSPKHSSLSKQCYDLDGLNYSSNLQVHQSFPSQVLQIQLISLSQSDSTDFFFSALWQISNICLSLRFLLFSLWTKNTQKYKYFSCCDLTLGRVFWLRLGDLFISQSLREFYASHYLRQILFCVYIPFVSIAKL